MSTQQERAELYKTIWKIANDLCGGFFVSALLTVVLGLLLCSCTMEGTGAFHCEKESASDSTSIGLHIVGTDTIYPGFSIDTAWLPDPIVLFKP